MKKHAIILFLFLILSSNVFGEQGNYSSGMVQLLIKQ